MLEQSATKFLSEAASTSPIPFALAKGDGIGPEISDAVLHVLDAAGAGVEAVPVEMGAALWAKGQAAGIDEAAWEAIDATRLLLKGPMTTPQGSGVKSINVTLRKTLGLWANVRPCRAWDPWIPSSHPSMDLVVVRENEEDLYAGIEHRQTPDVVQSLKLVTRKGCERIVRYAFELARAQGRSSVTCVTKDNIMKLADGLFHKVFDEVGAEYPDLVKKHRIVDIAAARLATSPHLDEVIVTLNLYGDILSDIAAEVSGSVGIAPSSNLGARHAVFEAVHGSAPDIAGQDKANPSGLLLSAVEMLQHIGRHEAATRIRDAWALTLEDGLHTADIAGRLTCRLVGTRDFARGVAERLGRGPSQPLPPLRPSVSPASIRLSRVPTPKRELVGVDVFLHADGDPRGLAAAIQPYVRPELPLTMITCRGVAVWPRLHPGTQLTDHFRLRFQGAAAVDPRLVMALQARLVEMGFDVIKTENLYLFDGVPGFSLGQGQ